MSKQPSITLTVDPGDDGRGEVKRQRTEGGDNTKEALKVSLGGMGGENEDMDIIPSDHGEEVKLPTSMLINAGALVAAGGGGGGPSRAAGLRARSDSAPMWGPGMGGDAGGAGGLSANWGRGRSGSSYGRGVQS
ncbi:hypothetical protein PAXRUDRAFT_633513 [Paxillus rubicundulus Ve08.2h10]|uniref:Uncharacterized protein n=1 Tax=Paxillus rubicundulus Ve08.2h10 TaxID=930991 RepID=A0A0D0DSV8_9AGAM|nr:hypothetical protein PAXRUDRAFT_633513 [Paxillus rubicundulus Ve08.2h10]